MDFKEEYACNFLRLYLHGTTYNNLKTRVITIMCNDCVDRAVHAEGESMYLHTDFRQVKMHRLFIQKTVVVYIEQGQR
jgi:hypothetical protein